MEDRFDGLVALYRQKLEERYEQCCLRPEVSRAVELLRASDQETVRKVIELLEGK